MLEHIGRRQRPAILIKGESGDADAERLEELVARYPWLWAVLAVLPGSATLGNGSCPAVDVRVLPLSPREIDLFTWHAAHGANSDHPTTHAGALYGPRRKILVVDDNTVNLVVAQGMLEALGHDVSVAQDGVQALEWCQAHPPDLVLMDIDMPVLSGDEATRYLRDWQRVGKVPPFPIVAATTLWHADAARVCADAEMDGLLEKPLRLASLNRELLRLLPRG
jgi:CheY-like chemotaxis protein